MVRAYAVAGAFVVLIVGGVTMEASAQSPTPPAQPGWTENGRDVEARIVDVRGDQVLLSDGMKLKLPASVANPMELQPGEIVKVSYEVKDEQAVMKSIEIRDAARGDE
jgi:hypothetical protein